MKSTMDELIRLALNAGFTHACPMDAQTLEPRSEVRDMCAANTCHMYGKRWSCPPGCGTLEECRKRASSYHTGILVQTVGSLEDSMDYEAMMDAEKLQKTNFLELRKLLIPLFPDLLPLGSGCCTLCRVCTFPDAPCRFPKQNISSLEAYGIVVSDLCRANGLPYYYGPNTIAYTGCFLLE